MMRVFHHYPSPGASLRSAWASLTAFARSARRFAPRRRLVSLGVGSRLRRSWDSLFCSPEVKDLTMADSSGSGKADRLNRFTTLPVLLDRLTRRKLVLLDPSRWEDKNDSLVLLDYKSRRRLSGLFACCFCADYETVHHWKTYSNGISGCCVQFDRPKLIGQLGRVREVRYRDE